MLISWGLVPDIAARRVIGKMLKTKMGRRKAWSKISKLQSLKIYPYSG
jgi:hypothetical protein